MIGNRRQLFKSGLLVIIDLLVPSKENATLSSIGLKASILKRKDYVGSIKRLKKDTKCFPDTEFAIFFYSQFILLRNPILIRLIK